jgi:prepilin-type N-terminal cleavage/methylation domain-containing protein
MRRGFTLIELVIMVAIVLILLAIIYPAVVSKKNEKEQNPSELTRTQPVKDCIRVDGKLYCAER